MLNAVGEHQRQHHATYCTCKARTCQSHAHQPLRCKRRASEQCQRHCNTQRRPRGAAQQKGVGQRIAKQALRHRTGKPQQSACTPRAQSSRHTYVPHNLPCHRVLHCTQNALKPIAADARTQQHQYRAEKQQANGPCACKLRATRAFTHGRFRLHLDFSVRHCAIRRAPSAMRGPGRTNTSD